MQPSLESLLIPDHVLQETGPGALPCLRLKANGGQATVFLHGAHVTSFIPEGAAPVLWMSQASHYEAGKPIRGGIPVCWPWFGPHAWDSSRPSHGVARLRAWTPLSSALLEDGRVQVRLGFTPKDEECGWVPDGLRLEMTLTVGSSLTVELDTINDGHENAEFEDALHTYFALAGLDESRVRGLDGMAYLDKMDNMRTHEQAGDIHFVEETDRVYQDSGPSVDLIDNAAGRCIRIQKSGSASTVVWNPWVAKSQAMADFGDEEWTGMCCVETANCGPDKLTLPPGERHRTSVTLSLA